MMDTPTKNALAALHDRIKALEALVLPKPVEEKKANEDPK